MNDTKTHAPGELAYVAAGKNPKALETFYRGLHRERLWFARRPRAKKYRRPLTRDERAQLGYPLGSELVGHRLSNGRVAWFVYCPVTPGSADKPDDGKQIREIAEAAARCMNSVPGPVTNSTPEPVTNGTPEAAARP
jgi:hypothetical protein